MADVVKPKPASVPAPAPEPIPPINEEGLTTTTDWTVLEKGRFIPVRVRCDGYLGSHPADQSCHSNLHPTSANILNHMSPAHSGGWFRIKFRISDSKTSPLWRELGKAGVEIQHLYCPHCRENVPLVPRTILKHLQPHAGANRINLDPQVLCMTLGYNKADDFGEEDQLFMDRVEV